MKKATLFRECLSQIPQAKRREFDFIFSVAENIVAAMERKGIKKAELAKRLNKTEDDVSEYLTGRYNFSLSELVNISDALGVPLNEIANNKELVMA